MLARHQLSLSKNLKRKLCNLNLKLSLVIKPVSPSFLFSLDTGPSERLTLLRTRDNVSLAVDQLSRPPGKTRLEGLSARNSVVTKSDF